MALLELLVAHQNVRHHARRFITDRFTGLDERPEFLGDEIAHAIVFEIADGRDNQIPRRVRFREVLA